MLPELQIGERHLPSYVVLAAIGMLVGIALGARGAAREGLPPGRVALIGAVTCLAGLVGARLWSVAFELPAEESFWGVDPVSRGGLSILGGLVGGLAGLLGAAAALRLGAVRAADSLVAGGAIGIGFGRLGCLCAGCCYGAPTLFPIALVFEDYGGAARPLGVPLHATQLYEAAGLFALGAGLWLARRLEPPVGLRLGAFLAGYGLLRSFLEPLREDWRGELLGVPTTQLAGWIVLAAGIALIIGVLVRAHLRGRAEAAGKLTAAGLAEAGRTSGR